MQFIDLKGQLTKMRPAIDERIRKVLDHGQFIMGPEVFELEEQLADYVGTKHCISCANGTDALQISLMALGIGQGDIVFTTAFSFFATAEVIPLVGATPYFVDIDKDTYNLCPKSLEKAIKKANIDFPGQAKAVIAVDLFGLPANYPELEKICHQYNLKLIEDAAQGFGGAIGSRKCGSFGDIATTSFFPAKPLGCFGDGGAIFTQDDELADLCRSIRVHGKGADKYENVRIGLNSRLDTIQAAILLEKLIHFEHELILKQKVASHYSESLSELVKCPLNDPQFESAYAQYTISVPIKKLRGACLQMLKDAGVPSAVYYPLGLNNQQATTNYPSLPTPHSDNACQSVLSLPMHSNLSDNQVRYIISSVKSCFN